MMLRVVFACALCRGVRGVLRLFGRGGTSLPGKLALRVCPDILRRTAEGVETVLVTGTNGKTTSVKMLCRALESLDVRLFTNRSGANLTAGIAAEFIANASLAGRARRRHAVIECDEAALKHVAAAVRPRVIVVTNIFRDQLDRYGEVTHTLSEIREGILAAPEAVLCLNADCSLTASLGGDTPNPRFFYGVNVPAGEGGEISDTPRCLRCGSRYEYDWHSYAHLGAFRCPACGYSRPAPDLAVTAAESSGGGTAAQFVCGCRSFGAQIALPSLYNVYNAAAALTAVHALGLSEEQAAPSLADAEAGFGRMELLRVGATEVHIILVKNPAGCDRALEYLASVPGPYRAVFCLNDRLADGTDVSWIWDADYERYLAAAKPVSLSVYGARAGDMRLRLKYAGADDAVVETLPDLDALMRFVREAETPVYLLPNYTSMLEVRGRLARAAGGRRFWK